MKDMTVRELANCLMYNAHKYDGEDLEYRAELLRRYKALEKELESWRGSRDGVLQQIDEMAYEIDNLRCCGNCVNRERGYRYRWCALNKRLNEIIIMKHTDRDEKGYGYCDKWQSDGMTRKERAA